MQAALSLIALLVSSFWRSEILGQQFMLTLRVKKSIILDFLKKIADFLTVLWDTKELLSLVKVAMALAKCKF